MTKEYNRFITSLWVILFISFVCTQNPLDCPSGSTRSAMSVLFPMQAACPSYLVTNYTITNMTLNTTVNATPGFQLISIGTFSELDGFVGYCQSPPIAVNNSFDPSTATFFTRVHHITIVLPIPWCYASFAFNGPCGIVGGRYPEYPSYFGPSVILNERPVQQECLNYFNQSNNTEFQPLPLWDIGTDTIGTMRIVVNDSCAFNSSDLILNRPLFEYFYLLLNGTFSLANNSVLNISEQPFVNASNYYTNSSGKYLYASYAENTLNTPGPGQWCTDICDIFPQPVCDNNPRTLQKREIYRQRSVVSLACKDSIEGFGFVWRVENVYSFNLHFDWFLTDILQNVSLPVATDTTYVNSSFTNSTFNIGYNDTLYNGFWPGIAGKRRVAANQYFYIPTYTPSAAATISFSEGPFRPTYLDLYAGYPQHYTGSVILAGIVDFFDMRTTLNMSSFIEFNMSVVGVVSPGRDAPYRDKNITTTVGFNSSTMDLQIVKDYDRQVILTVCTRSANTTATVAEIVSISGVSGWTALCDHINNNSKTWPDTLVMLYDNFPGLLPSNTSDPIPQCNCSNVARSPCTIGVGNASDTPNQVPNMMKAYTPGTSELSVNATIDVVCRITSSMLSDINGTITNPRMAYFIYNATNLTGGDYGYVWKIVNLNIDTALQIPGLTPLYINTINDLYTRWAFGTYTPPSGFASTTYPLPYPASTGGAIDVYSPSTNSTASFKTHDVTIRSGTTVFFFSLASAPHKMYGTFQKICNYSTPILSLFFCQDLFPKDPPFFAPPFGFSVAADGPTLAALPDCQCGVHVPCELGRFLFNIDSNLNLSSLQITLPPPFPPIHYEYVVASCVPTVELCNGRDDDCNGIIDDIPGYGFSCGVSQLNGIGICINGFLACPDSSTNPTLAFPAPLGVSYKPICFGGIFPEIEICNNLDDNCDGVVDNIVPQLCGIYTLGTCQQGHTVCVGGVEICQGEITPVAEVCGDGLDNDCNGVIDNGCPGVFSMGASNMFSVSSNNIQPPTVQIGMDKSRLKYMVDSQNKNSMNIALKVDVNIHNTGKLHSSSNEQSKVHGLSITGKNIKINSDDGMASTLTILNEIAGYFVSIYTALWSMFFILLFATIIIGSLCLFGPHGGCCMWAGSSTSPSS